MLDDCYDKQFTRMWLADRIGECKILIRKAVGWSLSFCVPQIVWVTTRCAKGMYFRSHGKKACLSETCVTRESRIIFWMMDSFSSTQKFGFCTKVDDAFRNMQNLAQTARIVLRVPFDGRGTRLRVRVRRTSQENRPRVAPDSFDCCLRGWNWI